MKQTKRQSILCPNCRKLISSDEPMCPYCNTVKPGSSFRNNSLVRNMDDPRTVALAIIWVNDENKVSVPNIGINFSINKF